MPSLSLVCYNYHFYLFYIYIQLTNDFKDKDKRLSKTSRTPKDTGTSKRCAKTTHKETLCFIAWLEEEVNFNLVTGKAGRASKNV